MSQILGDCTGDSVIVESPSMTSTRNLLRLIAAVLGDPVRSIAQM